MESKNSNKPVAVLLATYMRSGSSLTGEILQQSSEAFYMFEPLHAFIKGNMTLGLKYANGTTRYSFIFLHYYFISYYIYIYANFKVPSRDADC